MEAKGYSVMKGLLSPLRTGLHYEWIVLIVVAPLLMFPTVRPQWTAWALITLLLLVILRLVLRREAWPVPPFNGALFLFVLMVLVSVLVTAAPELTLPKATNLILGVMAVRIIAFVVHRERGLVIGWGLLLLTGFAMITVGVLSVQWFNKVPFVSPLVKLLPQSSLRLPEAPSRGVHPNELGWILAFYVPVVAGVFLNFPGSPRPVKRTILIFSVLLMLFVYATLVVFLTQSRSGWFGSAGGILLVAVVSGLSAPRSRVRQITRYFVVLAGLAFSVVLIARWGFGVAQVVSFLQKGWPETSVGAIDVIGRLEVWSRAVYALQDFSFTGIGLGTFRRVAPLLYPYFVLDASIEGPPDAHNLLLQAGVDFGFPGLITYLALILIASGTIAVYVRGDGWERTVAFSLLGGLVGIHLYGLTDTISFGAKPGILFWMAIGLLGALANIPRVKDATVEHD